VTCPGCHPSALFPALPSVVAALMSCTAGCTHPLTCVRDHPAQFHGHPLGVAGRAHHSTGQVGVLEPDVVVLPDICKEQSIQLVCWTSRQGAIPENRAGLQVGCQVCCMAEQHNKVQAVLSLQGLQGSACTTLRILCDCMVTHSHSIQHGCKLAGNDPYITDPHTRSRSQRSSLVRPSL
jgi:hypothetical protein